MNILSSAFLSQITERPQSLLPPCAQSANSNIQYTPRLTYYQEWYSIFLTTMASETCSSWAAGVAASSWLFLLCLGWLQHLMWQGKVICYRVLNHLPPMAHLQACHICTYFSHTHTHTSDFEQMAGLVRALLHRPEQHPCPLIKEVCERAGVTNRCFS